MNSIRQHIRDIFNDLMHLDPHKEVPSHPQVQANAYISIRATLLKMHAQVDTAEEIISHLGIKSK